MFVINANVPATQVFEGMERKILSHCPQLMCCEVCLKGGVTVPEHDHQHQQATYLISGRLRADVGGEIREIGPGDSLFLGENVPHSILALEDSLILDIFTPRRDDFL